MDKKSLREYRELILEVEMLEEKTARLRSEISVKNQIVSDMPRGGEQVEMSDKIVRLVELQHMCNEQWDKAIDLRIEIEEAVQKLDRPIERTLMTYRYIMGMNWNLILTKLDYGWAQTHRIHNRALKKMIHNDTQKCDIV